MPHKRFWPMARGHELVSPFGPRGNAFHRGQDFGWRGGSAGLPVYAAQGGTVEFVAYDAPTGGPGSGFGWFFGIDHPTADGSGFTVYGHTLLEVPTGARVEAGQRVGRINGDRATNGQVDPHLHFEVFPSTYQPGRQLDPLGWLAGATYPNEQKAGGAAMDLLPYREQMGAHLWDDGDGTNTAQFIVQHTTESESGNTNVIDYLQKTRNGSYQTMVDFDGEEVRMVPDNRQAWGAGGQGNRRGLHVCAMGRAAWSRARWLSETLLLERTAMRYAAWSKERGIPLVKITASEARAGRRGVLGHADISDAWGEVDHHDPGPNFPYDVVIGRAKQLLGQEDSMSAAEVKQITDFVAAFVGPIGSDTKDIREQMCGAGSRDAGEYDGWPQLGGKTVVDGVAAALEKATQNETALTELRATLARIEAKLNKQ